MTVKIIVEVFGKRPSIVSQNLRDRGLVCVNRQVQTSVKNRARRRSNQKVRHETFSPLKVKLCCRNTCGGKGHMS
jgi:hypothetical protein